VSIHLLKIPCKGVCGCLLKEPGNNRRAIAWQHWQTIII
jgi:hypothetical protein